MSRVRGIRELLAVTALLVWVAATHGQAQITIMPLGDSLTWGYDNSGVTSTTPQYNADGLEQGGYRSPLYSELTSAGIDVNYVGVNTGNPSPLLTAAGQTGSNGFNGYTISQIDNNLAGSDPTTTSSNLGGYWLTGGGGTGRGPETADVILLQIGANDLTTDLDPAFTGTPGTESDTQFAADETLRLQTLINNILTLEPKATLLVDGTTPLLNGAIYTNRSQDYDTDVANLISTSYTGTNVHYVDMWDAIYNNPTTPGYEFYQDDGVHLDTAGYDVMAQTWDDAIMEDVDFADYEAVPEPSTCGLLALGALLLVGLQRLRPKSSGP